MAASDPYQRRLFATALVMGLSLPLLIVGAVRTMDSIHTSAVGWLEESDPARRAYAEFSERFEGGNFVLVSWDGCTLSDPRLARLHQRLDPESEDAPPQVRELVRRALSGRSVLERLTSEPLEHDRQRAIQRLTGTLIGPDGETTCLMVVLSREGAERRAESVGLVVETAEAVTGLDEEALYLAGPPVDALAIDVESDRNVDMFSGPSALVCFALAWWSLRSARLSVAILAVAGYGQLMTLGALSYFGVTMDAVLIVLPPMVFVLTVSAGIHLANYYFDQRLAGAGADAPRLALRQGFMPCVLAALTTAIGVGSLVVSRIVPVSMFGLFGAAGVVITVALLLLTLPGVMARWPVPPEAIRKRGAATAGVVGRLRGLGGLVCRHATPITVVGVATLVFAGFGLSWVRTSINVRSLFPPESRVIRDFRWIEQHVGPLVPLEVVLHFEPNPDELMVNRLQFVTMVEESIAQMDEVHGVMSIATFSPEIPEGRRSRAVQRRAIIDGLLRDHREDLEETRFLHQDATGQYWRISARVSGLSDLDYEQVLSRVRERVEPVLAEIRQRGGSAPEAAYTGAMPLVYRAQHALLEDMFASLLLAFALVWVVMAVVLADRPAVMSRGGRAPAIAKAAWLGALAMVPNLFPIVVVFGAMGWLGLDADIGSTMTACVALGIAVDDTLHFLAWHRRRVAAGDARPTAISSALEHCGRAMMQTTLVCGVGMLVFGLSGFVPTQRFSVLMFMLLVAALAADLVLLPAILASRLGAAFAKPTRAAESGVPAPHARRAARAEKLESGS